MKKVLAALSGGVDSSAALILLQKEYEVIAATLRLHDEEKNMSGQRVCCSERDIEDAGSIAAKLGIEHRVFDMKELFREKVIDNFISFYENGLTPNPCVDCNKCMKFGALMDKAEELGCDYIATGHYARIEYDGERGRYLLKKAISEDGNNDKDQSYVLYDLTQQQLSRILFPLGSMKKDEVRALAAQNGLINADKADSQDICFVPDGDYAAFIKKITGKTCQAGDVIDVYGKKVGRHGGLINYTIGQRKGLGISFGKPAYVVGKIIEDNTLIVGSSSDLMKKSLTADTLNWISVEKLTEPTICSAKTRYRMPEQLCTVYPRENGSVYVEFSEPQRAITPGQRVVFYDGDTVIGGGIIRK